MIDPYIDMMEKLWKIYKKHGVKNTVFCVWKYARYGRPYFSQGVSNLLSPNHNYHLWQQQHESYSLDAVNNDISTFAAKPLVSIITPVYNVEPKYLDACIQSVLDQYYDNWELCLYDDASTNAKTLNCLKHWEGRDPRIKVAYGEVNGHISHATNQAVALATGSWFAFLDHDDTITPWALYEVVKTLQANPEAKYAYTDEDKIDAKGHRYGPFFKPDFDIDYLTSCNYICHFRWCRADIYHQVGGERVGFEGAQDHDLALRVASIVSPSEFLHVSIIGYSWRVVPGSTAHDSMSKDYAYQNGCRAIQEYFERKNEAADVVATEHPGVYRVSRAILGDPLISIIVPFRDQAATTTVCVESVLAKSTYTNYEILLVDNQSTENETAQMLEKYSTNPKIRILCYTKPFNYSAINNYAAAEAKGEYLVLLNNDTEVISPNWIEEMLQHAQRPEVGAVGAKLLYPDGSIQHAGVVVGIGGLAGHAHVGVGRWDSRVTITRSYSAITGAVLMVKKSKYTEIGSLDAENFSVAFNDIDLCLRLGESGYVNIFTPYAELYHYESKTRGDDGAADLIFSYPSKWIRFMKEQVCFAERWKGIIQKDPCYNRNLSLRNGDAEIKITY